MALAEQCVEKEHYTEAEYFEFERTSFGRWEYVSGKIRVTLSLADIYTLVEFDAEQA